MSIRIGILSRCQRVKRPDCFGGLTVRLGVQVRQETQLATPYRTVDLLKAENNRHGCEIPYQHRNTLGSEQIALVELIRDVLFYFPNQCTIESLIIASASLRGSRSGAPSCCRAGSVVIPVLLIDRILPINPIIGEKRKRTRGQG
jgi:hypothetical protein